LCEKVIERVTEPAARRGALVEEERDRLLEDSRVVTLALDAEGGDHAPDEIIAGALEAACSTLKVLLVGRPDVIEPLMQGTDRTNIDIIPSRTVIGCDLEPASAVRSMQDSSVVVGCRAVAEGRSEGFVSAGSTGAMMAGSLLFVKRASGIKRPAIVTILPGNEGPVVFLDAGANADCRPENLLEFGVLGTAFARTATGLDDPRVGLLNIGEEREKGNDLARSAHELLRRSALRFIGNVEGRDLLGGIADVIVTDGFTGNVALKLLEGCAASLFGRVKLAARGSSRARLGGLLLRPALRVVRAGLDPEEYGGTYLLGVRGLIVICHGNSSRRAIANALRFGAGALRKGVLASVEQEFTRLTGSPGTAASESTLIQ
jgi:glycerol-3-phosphate acyltransferase PlsX